MRLAIFASGNGTNFEALAQAAEAKTIDAKISFLFCDKKTAYALKRAEKYDIPIYAFSPKEFNSKQEYETELLELLVREQIDLILLAGYMRIIGDTLLTAFPKRIINIHPALLPAFPGIHGIKDAFEAKVRVTGVTIHYVDSGVDTGPIIAQEKVRIGAKDTLESLEEKIHQVEHKMYPKVVAELVKEIKS